jgi:deoxyribose-phosphate aldolase
MTLPPWLAAEGGTRGIARLIDYTLLRPEATAAEIDRLCDEGRAAGVIAVCVNGGWVVRCVARLRSSGIRVAAVVGFPLGAGSPRAKAAEAAFAVGDGATELDMVMPVGLAKAGDWNAVSQDLTAVVAAAGGVPVKVILETALLTPDEIAAACRASQQAGAAFVKTSTGFHSAGGASVEAVRAMRAAVGPLFGVKASGGIRTAEAALAMISAGANRIGASSLAGFGDIIGDRAPALADLLSVRAPA